MASLREAKSGITHAEQFAKHGFRCQVQGMPTLDPAGSVDRRAMRFLGRGAAWNHVAMEQAIRDAGVEEKDISNPRTGIIMGSGGPSTSVHRRGGRHHARKRLAQAHRSVRRAKGDVVDRLGDAGHLVQDQGRELFDLVGLRDLQPLHRQRRRADPVGQAGHGVCRRLAKSWTGPCRTCSTPWARCRRNSTTRREKASRAYDKDRDGFVIAGGAGVLVLEELEHAKARGAKIYAEVAGYGATSDGYDMVAPSGEGAVRCMKMALETVKAPIDYINPHATSTPVGDLKEIEAIREVFGAKLPPISATKSLTGHSLGAAGAQEAIYSLLMMRNGFICESANIENTRSRLCRHADRARAPRQRRARRRAVEFVRLRRHQCLGRVQAAGCMIARSHGAGRVPPRHPAVVRAP